MRKGLLITLSLALLLSCHQEILPTREIMVSDSSDNYVIPIDSALATLQSFLLSENAGTKSSAIQRGDFVVKKWNTETGTKATNSNVLSSVYCVDFPDNNGSAILAADSRQTDKILCVTESGKITADDLELAKQQISQWQDEQFTPHDMKDDLDNLPIVNDDKNIPAKLLVRRLLDYHLPEEGYTIIINDPSSENSGSSGSSSGSGINIYKYGPLVRTKWGQGKPYNRFLEDNLVGCVPLAVAQTILVHHNTLNVEPFFANHLCDWEIIYTVGNIDSTKVEKDWKYDCRQYAYDQVGRYVDEVKYRCGMSYNAKSGTVGNAKKGLKSFGYKNVRHDFAHFGMSNDDINCQNNAINMLRNYKPVIMLAFCLKEMVGHCYIIDGYRKDKSSEVFHINWGWSGQSDGYYAKGCFNVEQRSYIEVGVDPNISSEFHDHYSLFHYYILYDL